MSDDNVIKFINRDQEIKDKRNEVSKVVVTKSCLLDFMWLSLTNYDTAELLDLVEIGSLDDDLKVIIQAVIESKEKDQ